MYVAKVESVYGEATLNPMEEVVAGSFGTWTLTYTVGKHGVDDLGTILIARRLASDWGIPQFDKPGEANYATVSTTGKAKLRAWFDTTAYIRPWKAAVVIRVYDGSLAPGDKVVVTFGDRSGGGPGSQAQSFPEETYEFRVLVDCFGTGQFVPVPEPPVVRVIGGPACRLRVLAPSQVALRERFAITVKAEDAWGNPAYEYSGMVSFKVDDYKATLPTDYQFETQDRGAHRIEGFVLCTAGVQRLRVQDEANGLVAESNPIVVTAFPLYLKLFWGDIHGQTETTVGTGTVEEYFRYGRDVAALDFISHCANDFQITKDHYAETQETVKRYNQPGRFVTFLGYEWSGNTAVGGDHNVYFLRDDEPIHRSSHWQLDDKSDEDTDRYPVSDLLETFRGRNDVMIIPHIGGRPANLDFHDPAFTPVIEVQSVHGLFYWFAEEALRRGLKVGFVASSDDHSGRQGSTFPSSSGIHFGMRGGLVAAYAGRMTREAIWDAIKKRRCYGTTGERIVLAVTVDDNIMGSEIPAFAPPCVSVTVMGTAPLESIEVYRGLDMVYSHALAPVEPGRRLKVVWSGARVKGRNRETHWDGGLTLVGGKIAAAREFAFDSPAEGIVERGDNSVRWVSRTCGDPDGVLLDLDDAAGAVLNFETGPCRFSLPLADLRDGPKVIEAGGVDQRVEVSWAPVEEVAREVVFEWMDEDIKRGVNPYWVKVRQIDGAMAWSSPVYVNY